MPVSSSRRSRRSGATKDAIVAPGFGTAQDVERLSRDLGGGMPTAAVTAMMKTRGRGMGNTNDDSDDDGNVNTPSKKTGSGNPLTSPSTSNAWASFMQEEGVSLTTTTTTTTSVKSSRSATKRDAEAQQQQQKKKKQKQNSGRSVEYDFSNVAAFSASKSKPSCGTLVQTGTLDPTMVGRKSLAKTDSETYHLTLPTVILPKVQMASVAASCSAAHAIAIDANGVAYGWGRNEQVRRYQVE